VTQLADLGLPLSVGEAGDELAGRIADALDRATH
jgi:hypothetical protein